MKFKKSKLFSLLSVGVATLGIALTSTSCSNFSVDVDQELPTDDPTREVKIVFWHCLGQENERTLQSITDEFNAKYDGKYEVVLQKLGGSYDELHNQVTTKISGNEVPALAMGYPDSFAEYITTDVNQSFLLRLDNFINDPEFGYTKEELDDFVDEYLDEGKHYQFEGTWSMPMYKSTEIMYYNVNYFNGENAQTQAVLGSDATYQELLADVEGDQNIPNQEHLDALKEYVDEHGGYTYEVPTTWDEMMSLGQQMLADRKETNTTTEFFPIGYDSDSNMMISQFAQRGIEYTKVTSEGEAYSEHFQFNTPEAKAFVTEVTGKIREGVFITKNSLGGNTYTNTYFNDGRAAMVIGSSAGSDYNVSANFAVGLAPVPYYGETPKYIMQGPSICFFNNEDPYIHKGAWLYYKHLADPKTNAILALQNSYNPVRDSSYETDEYKQYISYAGRGNLAYDIPAATRGLREYYMTSPVFFGSSTARTEIGNIISYVSMVGMPVDTAFTTAINNCNRAGQ